MTDTPELRALSGVGDLHLTAVRDLFKLYRKTVKILIVVDGGISLTEGPSAFGVGRVMRLLRESSVGCQNFVVDTARRENSVTGAPTYSNFRFDQQVSGKPLIDQYHEIWCFGFKPDNDGAGDARITAPAALPLSDNELKVLTTWMNEKRGGLLAMGDHDYLGASMCFRIPRIRSMRRWTNAQGVPPIGGISAPDTHLRHDTNQPFTAGELAGTEVIEFARQEDAKPQSIDWVPWLSEPITVFQYRHRPHPVLCHPTLGPIDVMPDHPHEGWCYEDHEIDLAATYSFAGYSGAEYPKVSGQPHGPTVIAHAHTTRNPPYQLAKGASPGKTFALASVYDGHPAAVGRVATDSTWHHWFDENIQGIEAAGGDNWAKISRYFLNVASWLAPPAMQGGCIAFESVRAHFTRTGYQEFRRNADVFELGLTLRTHLRRYYGPCWVTQWVLDRLPLVDADIWAWLKDRLFWGRGIPTPGEVCLSCPPFEAIEAAVLGGLVRSNFALADNINAQLVKKDVRAFKFTAASLDKQQLEGIAQGLKEFRAAYARSLKVNARLAKL